jgi:hypothetical protein
LILKGINSCDDIHSYEVEFHFHSSARNRFASMQLIEKVIICVFFIVNAVNGANILCLFGFASPSHFVWNHAIIEELARADHNLTVLSPNIDENNKFPNNVAYILLEAVYPKLYGGAKAFDLFSFSEMSTMTKIEQIYAFKTTCCEGGLVAIAYS